MHDSKKNDATLAAWRELWNSTPADARETVASVVEDGAEALADAFYATLMAHADGARLLDHRLVNERLRQSMAEWLRNLYIEGRMPMERCLAQQRQVGEVHARVGVSIELIGLGARTLRRAMTARLAARPIGPQTLAQAIQHVVELMDLALAAMNAAYSSSSSRIARTDEAYRIMFLGRDLRAERERQRSQLLEWAQQILMRFYWDLDDAALPDLQGVAESQFGLWLQHKASMLFDGAPEMARIRAGIAEIEGELLPQLAAARAEGGDPRPVVAAIHARIESIKTLLGKGH